MHKSQLLLLLLCFILVTGCAVKPQQPVTKSIPKASPGTFSYIVKPGDTLYSIARRFSVELATLQRHNNLTNPSQLAVGARLVIPGLITGTAPLNLVEEFIWPLAKLDVSSAFGARNNRHRGIDLRAPPGTKIYAAADGQVTFVGKKKGYGKVVILQHPNQVRTLYAHNQENFVQVGQRVRQGAMIASVGASGNATGYHLHFELIKMGKRVNPQDYVSPYQYAGTL